MALLALALGSGVARAENLAPQATQVQGKVDRWVLGPEGRPSGFLLQDHTWVRFRPESLVDPSQIHTGDLLQITGIQVLGSPNRVLDRVTVNRGSQRILDDSHPVSQLPYLTTPASSYQGALRPLIVSSTLLAVGARPDGQADSLLLADGTAVHVPAGGKLDVSAIHPNDPLSVTGVGASFSAGRFIRALSITGGSGQPLVIAENGASGAHWIQKDGSVAQPLVTPQGQVDGVLLTDGSAIRFQPVAASQTRDLKAGTLIRTAGTEVAGQLRTDTLVLTSMDRAFIASGMQSAPQQQAGVAAPGVAPSLALLSETAPVKAVLRAAGGEPDEIVLADGFIARIPAGLRASVPAALKPGDRVQVSGQGGRYASGSAIDASSIRVIPGP